MNDRRQHTTRRTTPRDAEEEEGKRTDGGEVGEQDEGARAHSLVLRKQERRHDVEHAALQQRLLEVLCKQGTRVSDSVCGAVWRARAVRTVVGGVGEDGDGAAGELLIALADPGEDLLEAIAADHVLDGLGLLGQVGQTGGQGALHLDVLGSRGLKHLAHAALLDEGLTQLRCHTHWPTRHRVSAHNASALVSCAVVHCVQLMTREPQRSSPACWTLMLVDLTRGMILFQPPAASTISSWLSGCSAAVANSRVSGPTEPNRHGAPGSGTQDGEGHGGLGPHILVLDLKQLKERRKALLGGDHDLVFGWGTSGQPPPFHSSHSEESACEECRAKEGAAYRWR